MPERAPSPATASAAAAGTGAVALVYVYFLIFAEFALLELARPVVGAGLRLLLGGLAAGGIGGGVAAFRLFRPDRYRRHVAAGFLVCGTAAGLAVVGQSAALLGAAALGTGGGLGWLTVTLVSGLRASLGAARLGLRIGAGTGLAYATCNLPVVFTAPASTQALLAAAAAVLGALLAPHLAAPSGPPADVGEDRPPLGWIWTLLLLALVWMDSAAFYIIQQTDTLKAATWQGTWTLWGNAATHLLAALAAGLLLDRGARVLVLTLGFGALALACSLLGDSGRHPAGAEVLYTAGVSLYSVLLVFHPAAAARPGAAARVFSLAGWIGSALGVGMAQDLHQIPRAFVVAAAAALVAGLFARHRLGRARPAAAVAVVVVVAGLAVAPAPARAGDAVALGREVYIAEGCIHCHSQYVRPQVAADHLRWGPAPPAGAALPGTPPLPGNRRLGPDLSQVGNRRSPEWNQLHLIAPASVRPGSRMPAYPHLFVHGDPRGDALVAYLASLGGETLAERLTQTADWLPSAEAIASANLLRGRALFALTCLPCHGADGRGDGPLVPSLSRRPPDLTRPTWTNLPPSLADPDRLLRTARLVRFGLPGTLMAGVEYFRDEDVVSLAIAALDLQRPSSDRP